MKTIALRFSDNFAPSAGTIAEHRKCIDSKGYVWYGKMGPAVAVKVCKEILENEEPRILLIHSGKSARYWAFIDKISRETPELEGIPDYYRCQVELFHTWFRVIRIVEAEKGVMSSCKVSSSGALLSTTSRSSMSPYFIIEYRMESND